MWGVFDAYGVDNDTLNSIFEKRIRRVHAKSNAFIDCAPREVMIDFS